MVKKFLIILSKLSNQLRCDFLFLLTGYQCGKNLIIEPRLLIFPQRH